MFQSIKAGQVDAACLGTSNLYTNFLSLIVRLSLQKRLPVVFHGKEWVIQGALLSYGVDFRAQGQAAARYVSKILAGAKPADLPVEQPTKLELAVNLKTAKTFGLTIPQTLLLQADQVIE